MVDVLKRLLILPIEQESAGCALCTASRTSGHPRFIVGEVDRELQLQLCWMAVRQEDAV